MMDDSFLRLVRSATRGSSQVRAATVRETSRRYTRSTEPVQGDIVRLQLVDIDGVMEWEDVTGAAPDLGRFRGQTDFRGQTGRTGLQQGDAIELEFKKLKPSKITSFLEGRDEQLTPHRGIRRLDVERGELNPCEFPASGRALVLIHGTFSNSESMMKGLLETTAGAKFLRDAVRHYRGNVLTFDHPTLSVGPILNAMDFQQLIGNSKAQIDLVSHSRGGLVARWWCETFDPRADRCRKAVLVGSPLAGTGLAAPPNIRETLTLLTQYSKALHMVAGLTTIALPVFSVVEAMLRVLTSITSLASKTPVADAAMSMVPGLFAMSRVGNNPELRRLLDPPANNSGGEVAADRYHAVRSNFESERPGWAFWRLFREAATAGHPLIDWAADAVFDGANDLVVDTASMNQLWQGRRIAAERTLDFGTSDTVHHLNYFHQPQTADFLAEHLFSR
ncbi:alpha/beta hydrolase [Roseiconus nitratireducens]|uniref:Alpha/beta hydrolase n=1 Tax=Roseiconus nitratireducens TaxID=2605748 RepID=A0A5M6DEF1_9BACT|nr:alpha/beta hydrolase [Roseiconus nitratireducens]KAA5544549.1 alpha/beta hydrolase [Roseiconus nitratireducens]